MKKISILSLCFPIAMFSMEQSKEAFNQELLKQQS